MQFSYKYSPTLISAPFNLPPQQSPLLRMKTSETGTTCSRSTFHQGLVDALVCVQCIFNFFPLTAILAYWKSYKLDWSVGFSRARFSEQCRIIITFPKVLKRSLVLRSSFSVKSILSSPIYTVNILHTLDAILPNRSKWWNLQKISFITRRKSFR